MAEGAAFDRTGANSSRVGRHSFADSVARRATFASASLRRPAHRLTDRHGGVFFVDINWNVVVTCLLNEQRADHSRPEGGRRASAEPDEIGPNSRAPERQVADFAVLRV